MTPEQASQLEREFRIVFPPDYRRAVTDAYPFPKALEELEKAAESLGKFNDAWRREDLMGFPCQDSYWWIGDDGVGGFYFIDTQQSDTIVYYCDHEDMPASIDDLDHITVYSFQEFVRNIQQWEQEADAWEEMMKMRVANRRWWQLWIPRRWPPGCR